MSECPTLPSGAPERWLPVVGFEGFYEVSDLGRVRSLPRWRVPQARILKPIHFNNNRAYHCVTLCVHGREHRRQVHVLVALAFLGPKPEGMEVRHLDGNPHNCSAGNLTWGTRSENMRDMVRHGTNLNAAKTHCKHGHEFTPENTVIITTDSGRPGRMCLTCKRKSNRLAAARIRAARRSAQTAA